MHEIIIIIIMNVSRPNCRWVVNVELLDIKLPAQLERFTPRKEEGESEREQESGAEK